MDLEYKLEALDEIYLKALLQEPEFHSWHCTEDSRYPNDLGFEAYLEECLKGGRVCNSTNG